MNFLNNLDVLLKRNNLSRAELARQLNIAPSTINSWYAKGCENISLRFLIKISNYFHVTIDDLVNSDFENNDDNIDMKIIQMFCKWYKEKNNE